MKKVSIFTAAILVILTALAVVGMAFAQAQSPPDPDQPFEGTQPWGPGAGMMSRGGGMMGGRWNRGTDQSFPDGYGPMHETMISALAEALNLTPEDLEARRAAGETMWDIAQEKGLSQEQFQATMLQARSDALNQAVADGVISQEQADWMLERMNGMWSSGYGPGAGSCPGMGGGFQGQRGGWRWNR